MIRSGIVAALVLLVVSAPVAAQNGPPQVTAVAAPAEPDAIPLYGADNPGSTVDENWGQMGPNNLFLRNVTYPTLTPFLPDPSIATGAAVVVAPGGAFMGLAMSHEGWDVARALNARGIAAFVLKYRLLPTPADEGEAMAFIGRLMADADRNNADGPPAIGNPQTTEDGLAALALVRANAAQWGVDAARVGMIGFSAGAMTSLNTALAAGEGAGPAFVGYIYGPQDVPAAIPDHAPALFDAIALDDPLFPAKGFPIVGAWVAAGHAVELHAYQGGSHGFGLGAPGTTSTGVLDQFVLWLGAEGFLAARDQ